MTTEERAAASEARAGATTPLDQVRAGLGMLTRIPVGIAAHPEATGAMAFGLVGSLVGVLAAIPLLALAGLDATIAALGAVGVTAIVTGALHLDGLADTADALLVVDRAKAEAARKDPAVGAGGVVTLVMVLAADIAALASVAVWLGPPAAALTVIGAASVARSTAVILTILRRDQARAGGLGRWFADRVRPLDGVITVATSVTVGGVVAVLGRSPAIGLGLAAGAVIGLGSGLAIVRLRRQLDGDGLGAAVELAVTAGLVATALLARAMG